MKEQIIKEVEKPQEVEFSIDGNMVTIKGPQGEVTKLFKSPAIKITENEGKLIVESKTKSKKMKTLAFTYAAHLRNMIRGVTEKFIYKLKICSGHFPMSVSISGDKFQVKNFLGENTPRVMSLKDGADVKVDGDMVIIESIDRERAGQIASDIEQLMKRYRASFDRRIFQDGIYIVEKAGKKL